MIKLEITVDSANELSDLMAEIQFMIAPPPKTTLQVGRDELAKAAYHGLESLSNRDNNEADTDLPSENTP